MTDLPSKNNFNRDKEEYFDIDSLPDIAEAENIGDQFIDISKATEMEKTVVKKEFMDQDIPKEATKFQDSKIKRVDNKITIKFKISQNDLKRIKKMSQGLISASITEGQYTFDIGKNADGMEELYYLGQFVGEMINDEPRVYRRYFATAAIRQMVNEGILFEYETDKFTVHPTFLKMLEEKNVEFAKQLTYRGIPMFEEDAVKEILEKRKQKEGN